MRTNRWLRMAALALPPVLAAFYIGGATIDWVPTLWHPGMIDLAVYTRTGQNVLAGHDIFDAQGQLPWIYPGFAALLTVPFAWLPFDLAAALWLLLCVAALAAVLHRLGLAGWRLSALLTAVILLVQPVRDTLWFGQLGIFLVAAAVLDSMPGPRVFRRRLLPEGWLVGVVTAIKLTPAVVAAQNFFAGRRKAGLIAFASFVAATGLGFALLPRDSLTYWAKLATGDSGMNSGIVYATNQSVLGMWTRLAGHSSGGGLVLAGLVLVLGLVAGVRMQRAGQAGVALCLAGLTSLLASPISWSHHYVWLVPLAIVLWQHRELPGWFRWTGLAYSLWGMVAPFMWLRRGDDVEFGYQPWEQIVDNIGIVVGVILLVMAIFVARTGNQGELRQTPEALSSPAE